jgi:phage FluMu gp28-like protein
MRFASGFKITGLPSVARALRGKQGLVIVDEAAFHGDLMEVIKSALALLIWRGQVVIVSTHDGVANPFNQLLDDIRGERRKGATLTITFDEAIADGLYERVALVASAKGEEILPKAEWIADIRAFYGDDAGEELDCVPKEGKGSWIDAGALAACEHEDAGKPELYAGGLVHIGRDVARRRDLSVIHAFELVGDVLWMRERWIGQGVSFAEQDDAAAAMFARYRVTSYAIDQTGMGEKVVEDEQRRYGSSRCHGVLLTGPNRLDLATLLKDRVERTLIRVPPLPALRADYRAIKKQGGPAGAVRLVNEGEVHADEFWASGLACRGAATPWQAYSYRGLRPGDAASNRLLRDAPGRTIRARFGARRGPY